MKLLTLKGAARRLRSLAILCFMVLPVLISSQAAALTDSQKKAFQNGALYANTEERCIGPQATTSTASTRLTSGEVYILGDSITESAKTQYESVFLANGLTATVKASVSRSITGAGTDGKSGLGAIKEDATIIAKPEVKAIVVALGSNGNNSTDKVHQVYTELRNLNKEARIYWVDTIAIGRADYQKGTIKESNVGIYTEARAGNITAIPWFKTVDPNGDPENPTGLETDNNGYIVNANVHVHLTSSGVDALVKLVSNTVVNNPSPANSLVVSGGCSCSVGLATGLNGSDNYEKTWNFFLDKGLTPNAVAGIMGNLMAESGINPQNMQNSAPFPDGPEMPTEVDKKTGQLVPDSSIAGSYGYGIMQWTTVSRQQGLIETAKGLNKPTGDLGVQLEHIWFELGTSFFDDVLAKLREADITVESASDKVALDYATPRAVIADPKLTPDANETRRNGALNARRKFSTEIYARYSKLGGGSIYAGTGGCANITGPGEDTKYIDGFTIYSQTDRSWKDKPYGSSTIGMSGCGPAAMAMIITNLTGSAVSPADTTAYANELNLYIEGVGSSWSVAPRLAEHWGLKAKPFSNFEYNELTHAVKSVQTVTSLLQSGALIIGAGGGAKPFTTEGHYIVIRGVTSAGKFKVADSWHPDTAEQEWDPEQILSQMSTGSMYAITK